MRIYEIKQEFEALNALIEQSEHDFDEETGEFVDNSQEINELTSELLKHREGMLDYLADKRNEYKAFEEELKLKIKNLTERKSSMVRQQQKLLNTIDFLLEGEKEKTLEHTYFYRKTEKVEILDESKIPSEFLKFTTSVNKTDLKKHLKAGEEIEGAELIETIGLSIKDK